MAVTEERLEQLWILADELRGEVHDADLEDRIEALVETLNERTRLREVVLSLR